MGLKGNLTDFPLASYGSTSLNFPLLSLYQNITLLLAETLLRMMLSGGDLNSVDVIWRSREGEGQD